MHLQVCRGVYGAYSSGSAKDSELSPVLNQAIVAPIAAMKMAAIAARLKDFFITPLEFPEQRPPAQGFSKRPLLTCTGFQQSALPYKIEAQRHGASPGFLQLYGFTSSSPPPGK